MARTSGSWLGGGAIAALTVAIGVLAASTLVGAQTETDATPAQPAPPPVREAEPAAPVATPKAARPPAADAEDDAVSSAAPAKSSAPPAKPVVPLKRPRYGYAIIQALDKVTAETERFEVPLNTPVRYKTLIFTVRACETTANDEDIIDAAAHVEVVSQPKAPEGGSAPPARQVFKGWMFANSPGLNLLQHPIYDAWLIACKTELPSA